MALVPSVRTCLLITTYNWPEALSLTLASVARQTRIPEEIVIADDGSGPETRVVIDQWRRRGLPIEHVWQEDAGFRVARSRNSAIASVQADYIVSVDGDMVLHPRFIEDHVNAARPDWFIQGARPRLSPATTAKLLSRGEPRVSFFSPGMQQRPYALRSALLSKLLSRTKTTLAGIQGCNQSFWREHAVRVNGYDERFNGWGPEDREFAARLLHIGLKRRQLRHLAIAFHLYHPTRAPLGKNPLNRLLEETLSKRAVWTEYGLDAHLRARAASFAQPVAPDAHSRQ
ncbi:MAG TPA: glycosyltransferase family 2 protein [Steroidobacter sp.]